MVNKFIHDILHPQTSTDMALTAFVGFFLVLVVVFIILAIVKSTNTFSSFGAPKRNELVFYHADFCGYCHQFMPVFDETASRLQEAFPGLIITKLQHETDQLAILKAEPPVEGYPTLRLNGAEFSGPRTAEGLMSFVRENYRAE